MLVYRSVKKIARSFLKRSEVALSSTNIFLGPALATLFSECIASLWLCSKQGTGGLFFSAKHLPFRVHPSSRHPKTRFVKRYFLVCSKQTVCPNKNTPSSQYTQYTLLGTETYLSPSEVTFESMMFQTFLFSARWDIFTNRSLEGIGIWMSIGI